MLISKRQFLGGVAASALLSPETSEAFIRGGSGFASAPSWKIVPAGAGGFNTGASIGFDGTNQYMYVRCDVFGAYRWDPSAISPIGTTGSWTQLYRADTMPSDYAEGCDGIGYNGALGCYEIQCCYGTPNVVYAMFPDVNTSVPQTINSTIFVSTNYGNNWTRTGFTPIGSNFADPNDTNYKLSGPKIGVDQSNSDNVWVGTQGAGLFNTLNGGSTWSTVTSLLPTPSGAGYTGMVVKGNTAFICAWGVGVYVSANALSGASATFALTASGGPTQVTWADVDWNTGHYWCIDTNTKLWVFNGTSWSSPLSYTPGSVSMAFAIDPTIANHVFTVINGGGVNFVQETTNGTTFSSGSAGTRTVNGDIGWIQNGATGYNAGAAAFMDRLASDKMWNFGNLGPWFAQWSGAVSSSTPVTYTFQGRGIEEMVGISVVVPPGGNAITAVWDNGVFPFNSATAYPTVERPFSGTATAAWGLDYAGGSPNFLVMIGDGFYEGGSNVDATSSDYGQTWTSIKAMMPFANQSGACVAVSTTLNFMFSDGSVKQPYYTQDGGNTWAAASFPGVSSWSSFGGLNSGTGKWLAADYVNAGNFAAHFNGVGFFITTNGGTTWTGPFNATLAASFLVPAASVFKAVPGQAGNAVISNAFVGTVGGGTQWSTASGTYFGYTQNLYAGASCTFTQFGNVGVARAFGFGAGNAIGYEGWSSYAFSASIPIQTGPGTVALTGSPGYTLLPGSTLVLASGSKLLRGTVTSYAGGILTYNIDHVLGGTGTMAGGFAQIQGFFEATGLSANPVWQQIAGFAANNIDQVKDVSGDPNIAGRWYVTYAGSGTRYLG